MGELAPLVETLTCFRSFGNTGWASQFNQQTLADGSIWGWLRRSMRSRTVRYGWFVDVLIIVIFSYGFLLRFRLSTFSSSCQ